VDITGDVSPSAGRPKFPDPEDDAEPGTVTANKVLHARPTPLFTKTRKVTLPEQEYGLLSKNKGYTPVPIFGEKLPSAKTAAALPIDDYNDFLKSFGPSKRDVREKLGKQK
jgi:hypothetical protein